jgi:ABC-type branched-subunit amino acid transport system substrate-binding protein
VTEIVKSPERGISKFKVALMVPLSGATQSIGNSIAKAAQMAIKDDVGSAIDLQMIDTGSEQFISSEAVNKLRSTHYNMVIGPLFADHVRDVIKLIATETPIISLSNDTSLVGPNNLYLAGFSPQQQIERVSKYAANLGYKKIYALLPENRYGSVIEKSLIESSNAGSYELSKVLFYNGIESMKEATNQLVAAVMPKAMGLNDLASPSNERKSILIPEGGAHLRAIMQYISQNKGDDIYSLKFLGSSQWSEQEVGSIPELNHSLIAVSSPLLLHEFRRRYTNQHGDKPVDIAILGYDITKLAIILSNSPNQLNSQLKKKEGFSGYSGPFRFISSGVVQRNLAIVEAISGKFQEISVAEDEFSN